MDFATPYPGHTIMVISERDNLLNALRAFEKNKVGSKEQDDLFCTLCAYVDYLIGYCNNVFNGKTYSFDHVIPQLFELGEMNEQQWKQFLRCSLYALLQYMECLKKYKLNRNHVHLYGELIPTIVCDAEWLLANYEVTCIKSAADIELTCGSSRVLTPMHLKWAMNELFFVDVVDDLSKFDKRDIKPNVMFIMRQLLETLGNNLIGFRSINDVHGKPIHKFTQVAWDYLTQSKVVAQCVTLPCNISTVLKVSRWTNSFIHARYLHTSYMQFYALDFMNFLMTPPKSGVSCIKGSNYFCTMYGDFRVEKYNLLKADFEAFIKKGHPQAVINWMPEDEVGAYIISLD